MKCSCGSKRVIIKPLNGCFDVICLDCGKTETRTYLMKKDGASIYHLKLIEKYT